MRVFITAAILLLIGEVILGLAFFAGYYWWGGGLRGLIAAAIAAILMIAPWMGDMVVDFDSSAGKGTVRLAWWGKVIQELKPTPRLRICLLGICVKRAIRKPGKPKPRRVIKSRRTLTRSLWRWLRRNFEKLVPMLLAVGQLAHVLFREAREIELTVQSPTQFSFADNMIAKLIGSPKLGRLQLRCLYPGERRIVLHYRIGLPRAAMAALLALAQGRPRQAFRSVKELRRRWETSTVEAVPSTASE